jgi:hypothetical protein
LCFSNVSVRVDTEKAISLFLRGPQGTLWSFGKFPPFQFGVSQVMFILYSRWKNNNFRNTSWQQKIWFNGAWSWGVSLGALTKRLQRDNGCAWFLYGSFQRVGCNNTENKGEGSDLCGELRTGLGWRGHGHLKYTMGGSGRVCNDARQLKASKQSGSQEKGRAS